MSQLLKQKLKVVNLFGAPGKGKTAVRAGLFWLMRSNRMSACEVDEYAKYLIHSGRRWVLAEDQLSVLSHQNEKQHILKGKYEYAISDSPLQLCSFYSGRPYAPAFGPMLDQLWGEYDNINFFLTREQSADEFEAEGRNHDFAQAQRVEVDMRAFLLDKGISFTEVAIDMLTPWTLLEALKPGMVASPIFR